MCWPRYTYSAATSLTIAGASFSTIVHCHCSISLTPLGWNRMKCRPAIGEKKPMSPRFGKIAPFMKLYGAIS